MNVWLASVVAVGVLCVVIARRAPWRNAVAYGGLYLASTVALLSVVDAPRFAVYQHLRLDAASFSRNWFAFAILALQLVVVTAAGWSWRGWLVAHGDVRRNAVRATAFVVTMGLSVAIPTFNIGTSLAEGAVSALTMLSAFANLTLAVLAVPEQSLARFDRWLSARLTLPGVDDDAPRAWDTRLAWYCAAWAVCVGGVVAWLVFDGMPHIDDSVAYLFQAKTFAAGRLTMPAPPDSASFHVDEVLIRGGRWFGYGFPGWPALLSLGVLAGVPWLVNPVIAGVSIVVAHALVRSTHGRGIANLTAMLLAASPWALFMSGEFLGHPAAAMWLLLALYGVRRAQEQGTVGYAVLAGGAAGLLFLTRPLDAATGGIVLGLWSLGLLGDRRLSIRDMAIASAVGVSLVLAGVAYNAAVSGDPFVSPYRLWTDAAWGAGRDRLGFGADIGNRAWPNIDPLPGHGPADVVLNLNKNLFQSNVDLFGWAFGSLVLPAAFLIFGAKRRADRFLLALLAVVPLGYSLYWFSGGPDHGARYWYPILVPLLVASARGVEALRKALAGSARGRVVYPFVVCASATALLLFVPWRAATKYHRYREVSGDIRALVDGRGIDDALIFVKASERADYQSAYNLNRASLDGPGNVFARFLDPERRQQVALYFRERAVWVLERQGPDGGAWLIRGPYPPGQGPP